MLPQILLIYWISKIHRTNCFNFQSCFVRVDFGKFILLQNFLLYIFTIPLFMCLDFMFQKNSRYLVTYITKGVFSSLCVKNLGAYFQTEVRKRNSNSKQKNPVSLQRNIQ